MALTEDNMVMPISPYGGANNGLGNGDLGWLILILLFANGGWGMGGFNGGMGYDFPWLLNGQQQISNNTNNGFRDSMINDGINGIRDGINGISTQLCNGFAGVEQGANARQMADMQQDFAMQTAMLQGFNNIQSQFSDCCCENRLATCQTQNTIQNEGNMTRFADANNTRDIIENANRNNQAVLDKLCQLELDGKNDKIADLERQLTAEQFKSSQVAQNAFISQGFANEIDQMYNRLSSCPIPSTPVYGRTAISSCNNNNGCGCGCS